MACWQALETDRGFSHSLSVPLKVSSISRPTGNTGLLLTTQAATQCLRLRASPLDGRASQELVRSLSSRRLVLLVESHERCQSRQEHL